MHLRLGRPGPRLEFAPFLQDFLEERARGHVPAGRLYFEFPDQVIRERCQELLLLPAGPAFLRLAAFVAAISQGIRLARSG